MSSSLFIFQLLHQQHTSASVGHSSSSSILPAISALGNGIMGQNPLTGVMANPATLNNNSGLSTTVGKQSGGGNQQSQTRYPSVLHGAHLTAAGKLKGNLTSK